MNKCNICKFWERQDESCFGICSNKKFIYDNNFMFCLIDDQPKDSLLYCDNECYDASFITGENFGCIHFKTEHIYQKE